MCQMHTDEANPTVLCIWWYHCYYYGDTFRMSLNEKHKLLGSAGTRERPSWYMFEVDSVLYCNTLDQVLAWTCICGKQEIQPDNFWQYPPIESGLIVLCLPLCLTMNIRVWVYYHVEVYCVVVLWVSKIFTTKSEWYLWLPFQTPYKGSSVRYSTQSYL